jgi:hypothetical protein
MDVFDLDAMRNKPRLIGKPRSNLSNS